MKQEEIPKAGIAKFAKPEQVLYRGKSALIASYLGEVRSVFLEPWYLDAYNYSVAELFLIAIRHISGKRSLTPKHICFEVGEELRKILFLSNRDVKSMSEAAKLDWYKKNAYCIQITDNGDEQTKYALMFTHLNNYFTDALGIRGSFDLRKIPCLALTCISAKDQPLSINDTGAAKDQIGINNGKLSDFVYALNCSEHNLLDLPIVDDTGYSGSISINIAQNLSDFDFVNGELEKYNLKLIEAVKDIKVVVIESTV